MLHAKFQDHRLWILEKIFTIYGHGDHHMAWAIYIAFLPSFPLMPNCLFLTGPSCLMNWVELSYSQILSLGRVVLNPNLSAFTLPKNTFTRLLHCACVGF